jgi:hypothetical protein
MDSIESIWHALRCFIEIDLPNPQEPDHSPDKVPAYLEKETLNFLKETIGLEMETREI